MTFQFRLCYCYYTTTMARKIRTTFLLIVTSLVFLTLYHLYLRDSISAISSAVDDDLHPSSPFLSVAPPPPSQPLPPSPPPPPLPKITVTVSTLPDNNLVIHENISSPSIPQISPPISYHIPSVSILMPDWEVFMIVSPEHSPLISYNDSSDPFICAFETGEVSPAIPFGEVQFPRRALFKCQLPRRMRMRKSFKQAVLTKTSGQNEDITPLIKTEMLRWTYLVYDSLTTDDDVVLFVKGLNNRQGINREPIEFNCIFGDKVRTNVTSSMQEVFRCKRPDPSVFSGQEKVIVSLEIVRPVPVVVPSVAYYTPPRKLDSNNKKTRLCACTMVNNAGKFLKEWVFYHSRIGVEKFMLYDNASDDDLKKVVDELVLHQGYDVTTYSWLWPKTQEAGFSHSAIYAKDSCSWMMYIDVDEFVYSPLWSNLSRPSKSMLHNLLPKPRYLQEPSSDKKQQVVAEIIIPCYEFGPSNRKSHPIMGVTQGYNCRRKVDNRHKSIVLLDAVDHSLLNVVHHFTLKQGYRIKKLNVKEMVVNHYKFQAWPEFKAKFKRRVSAYVIDWTKEINPHSNDRTPGLGFSPVEPKGWPKKFCEVYDNGLRELTWKWFGGRSPGPLKYRMAWQR